MSYVEKNLIPGETVVYRGTRTGLPYAWVAVPAAAAIGAGVLHWWVPAGICVGLAVLVWMVVGVRRRSAEFAVTNKRVMIKLGILRRRTTETMLAKIEAVGVDQDLWGRVCNYGTITVTGSGGTRETFASIAAPLEFRRQIQAQLSRMDDDRVGTARAGAGSRR
jgi:uncharacterized membrane protein YdbT with pleckstrin-like domain